MFDVEIPSTSKSKLLNVEYSYIRKITPLISSIVLCIAFFRLLIIYLIGPTEVLLIDQVPRNIMIFGTLKLSYPHDIRIK